MNKFALTILSVIVFSLVAFFIMRNFLDFELEKALWVSIGAAVAMIIVDLVILKIYRKG